MKQILRPRIDTWLLFFLIIVFMVSFSTAISAQVSGTVFRDLPVTGSVANTYGVEDANELGVEGVTVTAYPGAMTTITAADGSWSIAGAIANVRIEFSNWPAYLEESTDGGGASTSVQFVAAPNAMVNFGLHNPADFVQPNPSISTSVYYEGAANGSNGGEYAHVSIPLSSNGHDFAGINPTGAFEGTTISTYSQIGATYGLAHQSTKNKLYLGAYHKRYCGYGVNGIDAIYQLDPATNTVSGVIELDVLTGTANATGVDPHDFVTMASGDILDLGVGNASFDGVGKIGFGDIDISEDEKTLFAVNLFDRKIYVIDVSDGITANAAILQAWDVPTPCGGGVVARPFALAIKDGELYVGLTCEDASNAYVYATTINTAAATVVFTQELIIPLNYARQPVLGGSTADAGADDQWHAWSSDPNSVAYNETTSSLEIWYPEPMLTDIEFDQSAMILGFRDRFGDQTGTGLPFTASSGLKWGTSGGDIIRACLSGGSYSLETGNTGAGACDANAGIANSGVNGFEYYYWDLWHFNPINPNSTTGGFHWETTQGGLVQIQGDDDVITTDMDPISDYSGGILKLKNDGSRDGGANTNAYTLYETGDFVSASPNAATFGKANGLGDLEVLSNPAPIEIGNLVWEDTDANGIQNAGEAGMPGITVELLQAGTVIATATTNANGNYIFSNNPNGTSTASHIYNLPMLVPDMDYTVRIPNTSGGSKQAALGTNVLTPPNTGEGGNTDINDSDGITAGLNADAPVLSADIPLAGANNHTFDFGFLACPPTRCSTISITEN